VKKVYAIHGLTVFTLTVQPPSVWLCQSECADRSTPLVDSVPTACKSQIQHHVFFTSCHIIASIQSLHNSSRLIPTHLQFFHSHVNIKRVCGRCSNNPQKFSPAATFEWPTYKSLTRVLEKLNLTQQKQKLFYRKGWTDRPGFWHGGFFRPDLHCVIRKFK